MSSLQLGLIIGGVVLVVGVLIYNWVQERRVRRRIAGTKAGRSARSEEPTPGSRAESRVEPTLTSGGDDNGDDVHASTIDGLARVPANQPLAADAGISDDDDFAPPIDFAPLPPALLRPDRPAPESAPAVAALGPAPRSSPAERGPQPDPDIECIVTLQPVDAVPAGALAAGLHARIGKTLRWFGRPGSGASWQLLKSDTAGTFGEIAACLLLADRAGAATRPMIDRFIRLTGEVAASLPAAFVAPDAQVETDRAEALDRICADLDVQIGLTVLKPGPAMIAGTRLRGVAEAAGFRLTDNGRFDWVHEDTGSTLYSLQNYRAEPFTADSLRLTSTPGVVFVLDVPRVADPVRVFDQMKLAAKRMTMTLDATLVDDNRRLLNDAALAAIRQQVEATAAALKNVRVDPGSPRALALFGG